MSHKWAMSGSTWIAHWDVGRAWSHAMPRTIFPRQVRIERRPAAARCTGSGVERSLGGDFPNPQIRFKPVLCQQCDGRAVHEPVCLPELRERPSGLNGQDLLALASAFCGFLRCQCLPYNVRCSTNFLQSHLGPAAEPPAQSQAYVPCAALA